MHQVFGPAETAACRHTLLAQASVLLVLLVCWLDAPKKEAQYQVTEFFSEVERIATIAKHNRLKSVAYDIDYGVHWCSQNPEKVMRLFLFDLIICHICNRIRSEREVSTIPGLADPCWIWGLFFGHPVPHLVLMSAVCLSI